MALNAVRRLVAELRARDPGGDGARRALRAAIAIPLAATLSFLLSPPDSLTPVFTLVGSIALLVVADFPGPRATRALAYAGLALNGTVLIALGTWAAPHPWAAVALCFAVGVLVSFAGLLSEIVAAGQRATLMTFVLPVCVPLGPLDERLLGWFIALAVCVPAALFVFGPRLNVELRELAAQVCVALADRIDGDADGERLAAEMEELRKEFLRSAFRPLALTAGSRSLIRVVSNLQWLADRVDDGTGELLGPLSAPGVRVLRGAAAVLRNGDAAGAAALTAEVDAHRETALRQYADDIGEILAEPDDAAAVARGRALLRRRTTSATIGLTGSIIASATTIDTRPVLDRLLGLGLPETGIADRVHTRRSTVAALGGYLSTRSVTVLGSMRTGLALALAVLVTLVLPVQNGLWVVLGTLSVLRTSAASTRTTVRRALTGTLIGFAIGAAVIAMVGVDQVVLWALLPVATFASTYVLSVGSFTASQAMFTMQVLIVFNMMRPTGWQIGLVRIEDIALGASVGLVVSALLWPAGARAALERSITGAMTACSRYLAGAVVRVTRGASPQWDRRVAELGRQALVAARTYGDALRTYLAETGGTVDPGLLDTASRIPRLRTAADLIAEIVPPPAGRYPGTARVLEEHAIALCGRLDGSDPTRSVGPMSDEFVPALRAEARGTARGTARGDDAAGALPLVTTAANIGELELIYPAAEAGEPASAQHG